MSIDIIVDSCCDLSPELRERIHPQVAPLKVFVTGGGEYTDDGSADIPTLIADMAASRKGSTSACPSVEEYAGFMRASDACFVITLSSKLSGSYNAARVAMNMVLETEPEKQIHVFDSESASAGEALLALFLQEKIDEGLSFDEIIPLANARIANMRTLFVLEDLGNFIKNGRLKKVPGMLASILSLCPIMSDDGHGDIKLLLKVRGMQNSLKKLVDTVSEFTSGAAPKSIRMVLAACNCSERAEALKKLFLEKCPAIGEIFQVATGALSSMYANDGGIIVAF